MSEAALALPAPAGDRWLITAGRLLAGSCLLVFLALPLGGLALLALEAGPGGPGDPSLARIAGNSLLCAGLTALLVLPAAFTAAYALTRSCIPGRAAFRAAMMLPLLAPSLLPALALLWLFGPGGPLAGLLPGGIEGPGGIVAAQALHAFPAALLILCVALAEADARVREAAETLGAGRLRILLTITLPAARSGLVSAGVVVFGLAITEFGIPRLIGGGFPVLATEIHRQVVLRHEPALGAATALLLGAPVILAFLLDRWAGRQRGVALGTGAVPLRATPRRGRDAPLLGFCLVLGLVFLGLPGIAAWQAMAVGVGAVDWAALGYSVRLAALVALAGTLLVGLLAYLLERGGRRGPVAGLLRLGALLPIAIPGLVLGLAYALLPDGPRGLAAMVPVAVIHLSAVGVLTAVTALRQLDPDFEAVGASLGVPVLVTLRRVILPLCLPALIEIAGFLFVSAMTMVNALLFITAPGQVPAALAMVGLQQEGASGSAAGLALGILGVTLAARLTQTVIGRMLARGSEAWRRP